MSTRVKALLFVLLLTGCASGGESVLNRAKDRCADRDGRWTPSGCVLRILYRAREKESVVGGIVNPCRISCKPHRQGEDARIDDLLRAIRGSPAGLGASV